MGNILRQARRLPPERSRPRRAAPGLAIAACLVLAVGTGYYRWRLPQEVPPIVYATTTGEQRTVALDDGSRVVRSEEHTAELQSLMRSSYAVFCLKNKKKYLINSIIETSLSQDELSHSSLYNNGQKT